jgi:hypothetical protein
LPLCTRRNNPFGDRPRGPIFPSVAKGGRVGSCHRHIVRATRRRIGRPIDLRQASAWRGGSEGATSETGRAGCGPTVEEPRSLLPTLKVGFFSSARARLETLFSRAVRTVAWNAVRAGGYRSRAAHRATPERSPGRKWTCTSSPQSVGGPRAGETSGGSSRSPRCVRG